MQSIMVSLQRAPVPGRGRALTKISRLQRFAGHTQYPVATTWDWPGCRSPVTMFLTSSDAVSSPSVAPRNHTYGMPSLSAYLICLPSLAAVGATSAAMPRERSVFAMRFAAERSCSFHTATSTDARADAAGVRSGGVQHVRHETAQADGQADARVLAVALRGEVVVTAGPEQIEPSDAAPSRKVSYTEPV